VPVSSFCASGACVRAGDHVRATLMPATPPSPPPPGRHPGPNHTLVPTHHTPIAAHLYLHNRRELRASGGTATQPASANYHDIPRGPCELSGGLGQAGAPLHGPPRSVLCPPGGRVVVMQHRLALYTAHTHTHTRAHACTCTHTRCRSSHVQHRGRPCRTHTHTHTHTHTPRTLHTHLDVCSQVLQERCQPVAIFGRSCQAPLCTNDRVWGSLLLRPRGQSPVVLLCTHAHAHTWEQPGMQYNDSVWILHGMRWKQRKANGHTWGLLF
jgi:hypothetical protein